MAILVAAGGAALGTAIGVGPGAGWIAGAALGNLLFPTQGPDSRVEGPRLGDLTVTSSAYGAPIAIAYGTLRMAGNLIWSSGISEQRNVSRSSAGGKGGGGATQTAVSYSYTASFAIAFGEGPAEDVLRLWADGKLIYDKTGLQTDVAKPYLRFRFHPGSETQLPDPLIEAHVGDGRAPAHRGLCYLVFEDLPLADFGNRIPNLTAEITFRREVAQPYQLLDFITTGEGGLLSSYQAGELAIDWRRGHGWFLASSSTASAGRHPPLLPAHHARGPPGPDVGRHRRHAAPLPEQPLLRRGRPSLPHRRQRQFEADHSGRAQCAEGGRPLRLHR
jgi:hypothetical protein